MALRNIEIVLDFRKKFIEGSFRGILTVQNKDIIIIGNKKSSILFPFSESNIKSLRLQYDKANIQPFDETSIVAYTSLSSEGFYTRVYRPRTKQEAYSTLVNVYRMYKTKAVIDTDKFVGATLYDGFQYKVINSNIVSNTYNKENYNRKYGVFTTPPINNSLTTYCNKVEANPAITETISKDNKNSKMIELIYEIINANPYKYRVGFTKNCYSGKLG
ncbi:MAG: hypothetical protein GWP10_13360 [Nitrospiraceae bacterium]|nr:hypothetical protein [Nitrospiraceae bacterium]